MSKSEDFQLEDEDDVQDFLPLPGGGLASTIVTSPTTDTLDSVALEPSPSEDIGQENVLSDPTLLEDCVDLNATAETVESQMGRAHVTVVEPGGGGIRKTPFDGTSQDKPQNVGDPGSSANISSYFAGSPGDDIFDSLTGGNEINKLDNELFMSIAISKSEEDIRASEMNAREITEQDVLSPDYESAMTRQHSFLRKQEEEAIIQEGFESGDIGDTIVGKRITAVKTDIKLGGDDTDEETMQDNIMHIHPRREHKTSSCEPETIAFEGEGEIEPSEQGELQDITNLAEKEEFEDFTAQNDDAGIQPAFMSQVSRISEHSDTGVHNMPQAISGILSPPVETRVHGPVLGSTPSQLSPMSTPVHQVADVKDQQTASPAVKQIHSLDSNISVPGSPFHRPSPEMKTGSVFAQFGSSGATDDAFTSILSMSDADRRHDAWIPSDATSLILKSLATGHGGSYLPSAEQLSTPGVISNEPQGDPVKDLVLRYMGEQEAVKRSVLTVDSVTQDVDGLNKLIESGCLRAAIDLTCRLLDQVGQGYSKAGYVTMHTPHSLQIWFVRLTLMVKLRMYEQAEAEMRAFQTLDTPDLYFQYYANAYPGRRGSMVSFSMRLLHAELPLLCGRSQETLDRLYYMLAVCNRIKANLSSDLSEDSSATHMTYEARKVSLELWNKREIDIKNKIGSTMLAEKDYEGALAIYNSLLEKDKNIQLELRAGIGRIHLQMGNIAEATCIIKEVEADYNKSDSPASCFNLVSKGLVAMCANNFHDAYQNFKSAVQMQPHNMCAVNNMAVCSLYLGRLKDALNTLEQLVHSDPANTLHEGVLFNLCTLYELETSRALHKKQAILDLVSKHKGDGFPVACLKMT